MICKLVRLLASVVLGTFETTKNLQCFLVSFFSSHVYHGKFGDVDVAIKTAKSLVSYSSIPTPTSSTSNASSDTVLKTLVDSLLREARLFSNLKHRNIIQLFGVSPCLTTKNLYLVMEYAHGGALSSLLQRRQKGLYPNVLIQYAKQIADGMKYLHDEACEHIIHRDLKCSNSKRTKAEIQRKRIYS